MHTAGKDNFAAERRRMVQEDLKQRGITDPGVLEVMGRIEREQFVLEAYRQQAYADGPLPIGMGQTISQPYIVALMTQELRLNPFCEVLEIGTGSGYQTAIIAKLAKRVYTVERFGELSESAQAVLGRLGIDNVEFYIGDGTCGWHERRRFDRVMVSAAAPRIPQPLARALCDGGVLVAPVGRAGMQELVVCEKLREKLVERPVCDVRFVPLVGKYGFEGNEN
jgi:protein-L-isoaspartate(D-aspartate) O-methyltransferase